MKNIIKLFLVLASLFVAQQAFAACYSSAGHIPAGSPPVFLQNGQWCTEQQSKNGVQILQSSAVYVSNGASVPQGYCSWTDRLANIGISTLIGGFLGALATDTDRGAGKGAAAGGFTGMFIPCTQTTQGAQVPRNVAGQGVQQADVATYGVACSTGGETVLVSSTEQCARLAMKIAAAATPATTTSTVNLSVSTPDGKIGCTVNTGTEKFRFNTVKGVKFGPDQCIRYVSKQDPLPKKEDMSML